MTGTDLKFFTNEPERDLYSRFSAILKSNTQFFDVLVGYFRTSGFFKMYEALETVEKIRILVGLNVDRFTVKILDRMQQEVKYKVIPADSDILREMKWGFIFNTEDKLFSLIAKANEKGKTIGKLAAKYEIGQGLNLKKSAVVSRSQADMLGIPEKALAEYTKEVFRMFGTDSPVKVPLLCKNYIMNAVIDHFGTRIPVEEVDKEHFKITPLVCPSPTFYRWVFGWNGDMQILGPDSVIEEYHSMARKALGEA